MTTAWKLPAVLHCITATTSSIKTVVFQLKQRHFSLWFRHVGFVYFWCSRLKISAAATDRALTDFYAWTEARWWSTRVSSWPRPLEMQLALSPSCPWPLSRLAGLQLVPGASAPRSHICSPLLCQSRQLCLCVCVCVCVCVCERERVITLDNIRAERQGGQITCWTWLHVLCVYIHHMISLQSMAYPCYSCIFVCVCVLVC